MRSRISTDSYFSSRVLPGIMSLAAYEFMILESPDFVETPFEYVPAFNEVIVDALRIFRRVMLDMFVSVEVDVGIGAVMSHMHFDHIHFFHFEPDTMSSRWAYMCLRAELLGGHQALSARAEGMINENNAARRKIRDGLDQILVGQSLL